MSEKKRKFYKNKYLPMGNTPSDIYDGWHPEVTYGTTEVINKVHVHMECTCLVHKLKPKLEQTSVR